MKEVEVGDGFKSLKNKGVEWRGVRRDEGRGGELGLIFRLFFQCFSPPLTTYHADVGL